MQIPIDTDLYELAKNIVYPKYLKSSAYRSGALVKKYLELGGRYKKSDNKNIDNRPLARWFLENWQDINPNKTKTSYPVYRPTKRISEKTPKIEKELTKKEILQQTKLKQLYKGKKNLPKF